MKRLAILMSTSLFASLTWAATVIDVLPKHQRSNAISTPAATLGFELGELHARPEQLLAFYQQLAKQSDRVSVRVVGYTHERRPILNVIITSPKNQARIKEIEAARQRGDQNSPLVVYLGYSVHGNEPSGANAAPAVAWHLASSLDASVNDMLDRTVVVIDPMFNPDGLARFASWVNSYRGQTLVSDPNTLEHRESWPSSRGNHYWFDLNRDWLYLIHPESQAHVATFQQWRPHILGDFHEQGTDATYFFQPGIPSRTHPLTPSSNQQLTEAIAKFHARALDARGEMYFSRESFDDFYYGKGSTYPDIQGAIGILFEQASSRGHIQDSRSAANGVLNFEHTIANQVTTSLSTLQAADAMRTQLIEHQTKFFEDAKKMAVADGNRAMLFAAPNNPGRLRDFVNMLKKHGLEVHQVKGSHTINGQRYDAQNAIAVPMQQRQVRLLEGMTELRKEFKDNTFYDVSAWSVTKAFDLASSKTNLDVIGAPYSGVEKAGVLGESTIAYVFDWQNDDAAPLASALLKAGFKLRTMSKPMSLTTQQGVKEFSMGSMAVVVSMQNQSSETVLKNLRGIVDAHFPSVAVHALSSGSGNSGLDLGSATLKSVESPRVALLTGAGLDSTSVGELWHWLDTHLKLPTTQLSLDRIGSLPLERYTHIVMADGSYRFSEEGNKALERFVKNGGVLIGVEGALKWASQQAFVQTKPKKSDDKKSDDKKSDDKKSEDKKSDEKTKANDNRLNYADQDAHAAKERIAGAIFNADIDRTHPIAAGLPRDTVPVFRTHNEAYRMEGDRYATVAAYTNNPVISGYVSEANAKNLAGTAVLTAQRVGSGSVILTTAALGFRSGWVGSRRLLDNAIFLGKAFDKARVDSEDAH
jgi:predicted RNA binding protein YcfA (HicA-like mRNA interferase family)